MGIFNMVDPVTGLTICRDDEVVAIMIQRRTGGYPDALTALASAPLKPTDIFEPASLPVFGKMGSYGDIKPDPGQASSELFQKMVGCKSWDQAFERATDFQKGGMEYPIDKLSSLMGQKEPVKEILGIAVFHRSTWDKVVSMRWSRTERAADVDTVLAILDDLEAQSAKKTDDLATIRLISLRDLRLGPRPYTFPDGREFEIPRVASALQSAEGGSTVSSDFSRWLTTFGPLGKSEARRPDRSVIEGLWDLQAFEQGLDVIGRVLMPAKSHGQYTNSLDVIETGLLSIQRAGEQIIERAEDDHELDDDEIERLKDQIARIDEIKERIEVALSKASPSLEI